jgi:TonB family protein
VLPFPVVKEPPAWPADVVRGYLRKLVVVYGQINTEGKLDQLSVKDSPDARLNQPVLDALQRWTFRPAQLNGAPVAVKVLLGIPLALSE